MQIVWGVQSNEIVQGAALAAEILDRIDAENNYLQCVAFSDVATFSTSERVNSHNVRIWGSKNPHIVVKDKEIAVR